ncbi:hypothetical protein RFI_06685 [Reticulomyxa filosa]|uniref:SAM domain-containing protein n=1 Tax=Reticulomyxa filosa TaxID=46433 RepID=X6NWU3_RETFI|nr:hypothetical protein RFI_06685 [Reticulomyxa filosa]|eukprot:ETO30436.1 hypothetical protein RFI_06685 [Reticulomyxa filosa]
MSDRVDVRSWLAVNKLSYVEKTFVERNIAIEELMDFDTEELKDFAKDLKLDALATRRFIKAIMDQKEYFKNGQMGKDSGTKRESLSSNERMSSMTTQVNVKSSEMLKSASSGGGGGGGSDVDGANNHEDIAPPEAAFGMIHPYVDIDPTAQMNEEDSAGEGEGIGIGIGIGVGVAVGEGAVEKNVIARASSSSFFGSTEAS